MFDSLVSNVLHLIDKQLADMSLQRRSNKGDEIIVLAGVLARVNTFNLACKSMSPIERVL